MVMYGMRLTPFGGWLLAAALSIAFFFIPLYFVLRWVGVL